ncbi:MAG TPA: hypothetical protein VFW98_08440 [Gemmatimonadaceae bacterium]|nr:hypothetical protein [Gemmatimonadaceae bacterium]
MTHDPALIGASRHYRRRKPRIHYTRPKVTPYQERVIFGPHRTAVIEASTKTGKTVGCIIWLHELALTQGRPGDTYWWVAPVYGQARIAFERMRRYLRISRWDAGLGRFVADNSGLYSSIESPMVIRCPSGAKIEFKSAEKPDNLYGEDVRAVVRDEASRMRDAAHYALRSVLTATRGLDRWIGNVRGRRNEHYKIARRAEAGEDGMVYALWTAWDAVEAGVLARDEVLAAQRDLPEDVFAELYLGKPSDDGGNPFGIAHIDAATMPLATTEPFVWGWDLAKSNDYTVGIALDESGAPCRFERWRGVDWGPTSQRIRDRSKVYSLIDSTGVGDPIVEGLRAKASHFHGYQFTSASKQQLMEGLAWCVQNPHPEHPERRVIGIPDHKVMKAEMDVFEWQHTRTGVRYSAPAGYHDDTVCALALAAAAWRIRMRGRIPNLPPLHYT